MVEAKGILPLPLNKKKYMRVKCPKCKHGWIEKVD